jgi:hypothetical protein
LAPELADGAEPIFHMQLRFLRRHKPLILNGNAKAISPAGADLGSDACAPVDLTHQHSATLRLDNFSPVCGA